MYTDSHSPPISKHTTHVYTCTHSPTQIPTHTPYIYTNIYAYTHVPHTSLPTPQQTLDSNMPIIAHSYHNVKSHTHKHTQVSIAYNHGTSTCTHSYIIKAIWEILGYTLAHCDLDGSNINN